MLKKPKYIDPRKESVIEFAANTITQACPHERQDEIMSILAVSRDTLALRRLAKILPRRAGLSYASDVIEKRARLRLKQAFNAARNATLLEPLKVLDVGCARAENARYLVEMGSNAYIGIDIDDRHFPNEESLGMPATLICGSAEAMPLPDNSIDLAISFNVFEHILNPRAALREIVRVLKPNGVFFTKFGPPFNAAAGPHLTRRIDLPYMHHLFPDSTVANFVGREEAYITVNKRPLSYYRECFFAEDGFRLAKYSEQVNGAGFWMLKAEPEITEALALDELAVDAVTAVVVKS